MAEKFSTSDVVSFLTGERACPFISSSSDSEVDGGTNEELEIGAGPVKRVRILSSMEGSDESDVENLCSESSSEESISSEYSEEDSLDSSDYSSGGEGGGRGGRAN